jgi:hypothetical protein
MRNRAYDSEDAACDQRTKSSQNVEKELNRFIELTKRDKEAQEEIMKPIEGSKRHVGIIICAEVDGQHQ